MARKIKKELTEEEKLEQTRIRLLDSIERREVLKHLTTPTYFFNVGDKVLYGAIADSEVAEVLDDGKMYLLMCNIKKNNYGNPYWYKDYRLASWVNVRPVNVGDTNFARNQEVKLCFQNSTVESLIHRCYFFGVDMEPEYQRDYVWSDDDRQYLIDSIFNNIDIGKFVFVSRYDYEKTNCYEILDGKQRLMTLKMFYENRFAYHGKFFNDLSLSDRHVFLEHRVSCAEVSNFDKATIYKYFLMLNRSGHTMSKAQLNKVEAMLNDLRKD